MNDLVSIITPSYNTASYIAETIQSVLSQTYTNWEMLIVDDCSTDNTDEIVAPFLSDSRIRYLKNPTNSGAALSRNYALREARGRWIAFLDSDDLWHPQKLEKQIAFMESKGCSFSYTNYYQMDEESVPLGIMVTGPGKITRTGMHNYNWMGCLTVMYDADVVGLIQIKDIKKRNDYAIWLHACEKAECYLLDEPLSDYRIRKVSVSHAGLSALLKWQYRLYRVAFEKNVLSSGFNTIRNMFFGVLKKKLYVHKTKNGAPQKAYNPNEYKNEKITVN